MRFRFKAIVFFHTLQDNRHMKSRRSLVFLSFFVLMIPCTLSGQDELLFSDDFESGLGSWEFTDGNAWRIESDGQTPVLSLFQASQYEPPVRSPLNMAMIKDLWVSDFVFEARLKSTSRQYNHRDLCVFFGWQSPQNFYYSHIAANSDAHANSIFLVDGEPRVSVAKFRTNGTEWKDDTYHKVRVVRRVDSGVIQVYFDDMENPIMTAKDISFRVGRIGVGSFDDTGMFDQVRVWGKPAQPHMSDADLMDLYDGLRVADVSDGMDALGLADIGLVDPAILPLWKDTEDYSHRIIGLALTVRYVPSNKPRRTFTSAEEFHKWEGQWYTELSPEPFVEHINPYSVIVIDGSNDGDTGTIGSNNSLMWHSRGARGVVTTGGCRDTDEVIAERIPLYLKRVGRGIRPGRNIVESVNQPVEIGGVLVMPGDVVVADGDGVVVVPREYAAEVAKVAHAILESDMQGRRNLYEQLGMPMDKSVQPKKP
jgi:regulator of RNase E activity RraA